MEPTPSRKEQFDKWAKDVDEYFHWYVNMLFLATAQAELDRRAAMPTHPEQAPITQTQTDRARRLIASALEGD